ncbi:LysR family transcriptional regulator [Diaphorobacter sp. HDW4A]|uniref:LysR family transcriptional regulator n=1 Tax=Diaphorobacter sp. HDW4A TaxID=2714924 RepID=UPI0014088374|nr:LysR family transcriptional regulator [Diaphorobacter sp. HDW4A]QIL80229.1 LysR family transcriptional regulator [Diaphorobacter sp. HDW4A]
MELRQLRQVIMLAETLNFRRAAERLHMAQPPLSTSIKKLEDELGVLLFERLPTGLKITPAGKMVLRHAQHMVFSAEQIKRAAKEGETGDQGTLRLGFVGSATYSLMPRIIRAFRGKYPRVETMIEESTTLELLKRVENHAIDVALVRYPILERGNVELTLLRPERMKLAVSADSPFAGRASVSIAEIAEEPFIIYARDRVPAMYTHIMQAFSEAGVMPRIAQEAVQVQHVLGLVESGLGVALVPETSARYAGNAVVLVNIDPQPKALQVGLALACLPDALTPTARNFIATAHAVVQEPET